MQQNVEFRWGKKTFLGNKIMFYSFCSKFSTFNQFWKKTRFFSKKKPNCFLKTQNSNVFENSYYFICIRRQICFNLVIQNFQTENGPPAILPEQFASKRKTHAARERFSFHTINMTKKIKQNKHRISFWQHMSHNTRLVILSKIISGIVQKLSKHLVISI